MPLYEIIMIAKPGLAKETANLLHAFARNSNSTGCVVRNANILGDRILSNPIKSKEKEYFQVGRYVQVLVDCNPKMMPQLRRNAMSLPGCLRVNFHSIKDFYEEQQEQLDYDEKLVEEEKQIMYESEKKDYVKQIIEDLKGKVYFN